MTHNIGFQTVEYKINAYTKGCKNINWTRLCDVPQEFKMSDLEDYKFTRQVEELHNLSMSQVKIRLV